MIPTTQRPVGDPEWIGRVTLTLIVASGALATIICVSNALRAGDHMVRLENSVAELSQFIASSHASIRERVAARESLDDDVAALDSGVERRLAGIRGALKQPAGVAWWTSQLNGSLNLYRLAEDRRVYVSTAIAALYAPDDRDASLRRLELSAQKMIVAVDAARDSIVPSRAQARDDANAMVTLALGIGGLVILYLVWLPVFGRGRPRLPRTATIHRIPAIF